MIGAALALIACRGARQEASGAPVDAMDAAEATKTDAGTPPKETPQAADLGETVPTACPAGLQADTVIDRFGVDALLHELDGGAAAEGDTSQMGDLNSDGRPDLLFRWRDFCGNWGECYFAVLVNCGNSRYATVWGPEYAFDLKRSKLSVRRGTSSWSDLELSFRADNHIEVKTLRFSGQSYEFVKGSSRIR